MNAMKSVLLTTLRSQESSRSLFRHAAHQLFEILATEVADLFEAQHCTVATPLGEADGKEFVRPLLFVPILRSGITMLPPFLHYFPDALIGVVGVRREEQTAEPMMYYHNLPPLDGSEQVVILDPMLATGGTMIEVIKLLLEAGVPEQRIIFVGVVCSPEGRQRVQREFPRVTLHIAATDDYLNDHFFIVPGLGDFGDRFFGTE